MSDVQVKNFTGFPPFYLGTASESASGKRIKTVQAALEPKSGE